MKFDYDVLHNFISPVTGRVLSDPDYVLVGDYQGIATPSPALIDIRIDLINLRQDFTVATLASYVVGSANPQLPNAQVLDTMNDGFMFNTGGVVSTTGTIPIGGLPDLTEDYLWLGDDMNRPVEVIRIKTSNLPSLSYQSLWTGSLLGNAQAITKIAMNNLPDLESQFLWSGDLTNRPVPISQIKSGNLPDLSTGAVWEGSALNRPAEVFNFVKGSSIPPIIAGHIAIWDSQFVIKDSEIPITIFETIEGQIEGLEVQVDALEVQVDAIETQIVVIEAEIVALEAEIIALEVELLAAIAALEIELLAAIAALEAEILAIIAALSLFFQDTIDDLRLNNISSDADVSIHDFKIIDLADGVDPQDAATMNNLELAVQDISAEGFITGTMGIIDPLRNVLLTTRTPGNDIDMFTIDRVINLAQDPTGDFDAISLTFLWNLMHDQVNIEWP